MLPRRKVRFPCGTRLGIARVWCPLNPGAMKKNIITPEHMLQLRKNHQLHLLTNPNYFGTIKDKEKAAKFPAVLPDFDGNTYYEDIECVSYDPAKRLLHATVKVKKGGGYSGSPCAGGSREYVRFFVDYRNNGNWVDEGVAFVGVYDHPFEDDLCYDVQLAITPDLQRCCDGEPVLPRVRAILSWNTPPPAGDPDHVPVWGGRHEVSVQIAPRRDWLCWMNHLLDDLKLVKPGAIFEKEIPLKWKPDFDIPVKWPMPEPKPLLALATPAKIKADMRLAFSVSQALAAAKMPYAEVAKLYPGIDLGELLTPVFALDFNTDYEEVHCVSLNRELNRLHATVEVKRDSGYVSGLCDEGSKEYVAFYMDFGSGWQYMGTSSTTVHNIPRSPDRGLFYDVTLPVDLDAHRKQWCTVGKAKARAILSWNTPPPPNAPEHRANWGDREDCTVEVKPLPAGVIPGMSMMKLEKVGGMEVGDINMSGLATTNGATSLGGANNSPFHGNIELVGNLFLAGSGAKYRFLVRTPDGAEQPLLQNQRITIDTLGTLTSPTLVPDADGWMDYLGSSTVEVVGGYLGSFYAGQEGLYHVRMQAKNSGGTILPGSALTTIKVDPHQPDVDITITSGVGDCGNFNAGDTISGTYRFIDAYPSSFSIYMTPGANGTVVDVDGLATNQRSYAAGTLSDGGRTGSWSIATTASGPNATRPCGYNVWISGSDRAIVNSHRIGHDASMPKGFCLKPGGN